MADTDQTDFTTLTVDLLSAYFANNTVDSAALPGLIRSTHDALKQIDGGTPEAAAEPEYKPAVSIRKSTASSDFLISLVDGKQYKTLKRHLKSNGLTPQQYRERYGLPRDYPMIAPAFAEARRMIAAKIGLGRKPKPDAAAASDAATTAAEPSTATSPAEAPAPAKKAAAKPRTAARAATPAKAKSAVAKSKTAPTTSAPTPPAEPVTAEPVAAAIAKPVAKKAPAAKAPAKAKAAPKVAPVKAAPVETPSIEGKPAKAPKAKPIAAAKATAKRTPKPKAAAPAPDAAEN